MTGQLTAAAAKLEEIERTTKLAKAYLVRRGEEAVAEAVAVQIAGSNFGDGSQQLAHALTTVIRARLLELCGEALSVLDAQSERAAEAMQAALAGRGTVEEPAPPIAPTGRGGRPARAQA